MNYKPVDTSTYSETLRDSDHFKMRQSISKLDFYDRAVSANLAFCENFESCCFKHVRLINDFAFATYSRTYVRLSARSYLGEQARGTSQVMLSNLSNGLGNY